MAGFAPGQKNLLQALLMLQKAMRDSCVGTKPVQIKVFAIVSHNSSFLFFANLWVRVSR